MALFSMAWQKIGQITHLSICDGIDDTQICINKSMTVTFCLSQNNFCGGRFYLVQRQKVSRSEEQEKSPLRAL